MRTACLVALAVCLAPAAAQEAGVSPPEAETSAQADTVHAPEAPLFADDAPLALTLTFGVDEVTEDRTEKPPWYPATLTHGDDAESVLDIGVRTRGFYRLNYLDCNIPPLRLNIRRGEAGGTVFEGQDKLKLVTHCKDGSDRYQRYVFQEYLIYRAYALLTDMSFKTRLVHITYRDATGERDDVTAYGFLIEDDDELAARLGGEILERERIFPGATDQEQAALMAVFHYMVGNTDWTVQSLHNIRLVYRPEIADSLSAAGAFDHQTGESALVAVPYDFDWSGLISTSYATPDPRLEIESVRERKFMGFCQTVEEFEAAVGRFREKEDELYALFRDSPYLEPRVAERSEAYIRSFFEEVETRRGVERAFLRDCFRE